MLRPRVDFDARFGGRCCLGALLGLALLTGCVTTKPKIPTSFDDLPDDPAELREEARLCLDNAKWHGAAVRYEKLLATTEMRPRELAAVLLARFVGRSRGASAALGRKDWIVEARDLERTAAIDLLGTRMQLELPEPEEIQVRLLLQRALLVAMAARASQEEELGGTREQALPVWAPTEAQFILSRLPCPGQKTAVWHIDGLETVVAGARTYDRMAVRCGEVVPVKREYWFDITTWEQLRAVVTSDAEPPAGFSAEDAQVIVDRESAAALGAGWL